MRIFLSGPMGSGKSDVAPRVARRLGVAALDLDCVIAEETGASVSELFRREGEPRFREREADVLRRLLASAKDCVIALGGGTVTNASLRHALLQAGTLVTLEAPIATLAARVGRAESRPLLSGRDVAGELEALVRGLVRDPPLERYGAQSAAIVAGRWIFGPEAGAAALRGIFERPGRR